MSYVIYNKLNKAYLNAPYKEIKIDITEPFESMRPMWTSNAESATQIFDPRIAKIVLELMNNSECEIHTLVFCSKPIGDTE